MLTYADLTTGLSSPTVTPPGRRPGDGVLAKSGQIPALSRNGGPPRGRARSPALHRRQGPRRKGGSCGILVPSEDDALGPVDQADSTAVVASLVRRRLPLPVVLVACGAL